MYAKTFWLLSAELPVMIKIISQKRAKVKKLSLKQRFDFLRNIDGLNFDDVFKKYD